MNAGHASDFSAVNHIIRHWPRRSSEQRQLNAERFSLTVAVLQAFMFYKFVVNFRNSFARTRSSGPCAGRVPYSESLVIYRTMHPSIQQSGTIVTNTTTDRGLPTSRYFKGDLANRLIEAQFNTPPSRALPPSPTWCLVLFRVSPYSKRPSSNASWR